MAQAALARRLVGVGCAHLMFDLSVVQFSQTARSGPAQWLAEWVATFGLAFTILATLRARSDAVAAAVGLYITAAYWFTASTSFAKPAVTIPGVFPIRSPASVRPTCRASSPPNWSARVAH